MRKINVRSKADGMASLI